MILRIKYTNPHGKQKSTTHDVDHNHLSNSTRVRMAPPQRWMLISRSVRCLTTAIMGPTWPWFRTREGLPTTAAGYTAWSLTPQKQGWNTDLMKGNQWVQKAGHFCGGTVGWPFQPSSLRGDLCKGSLSAGLTIPKLQKLGWIYLNSLKNEHLLYTLQKCCLEDYFSSDMLSEIRWKIRSEG